MEVLPQVSYLPSGIDSFNVFERTFTLHATARSTDAVRKNIAAKAYSQMDEAKIFFTMHDAHVRENPKTVYHHENVPKMGEVSDLPVKPLSNRMLEPGRYRTGECSVGDDDHCFFNMSAEDLPTMGTFFFSTIDLVLKHAEFLQGLHQDAKLGLLVFAYQGLILGHFVKNASGRTDEDYLVHLASQLDLPFTISQTGFRGQMAEDMFEAYVERSLWLYRDNVTRIDWSFFRVRRALEQLQQAASKKSTYKFDAVLQYYSTEDRSFDPLQMSLQKATKRTYRYLPADVDSQHILATAAAHWSLIDAQPYNPHWDTAREIRAYLFWHIAALEDCAPLLRDRGHLDYSEMLGRKAAMARDHIAVVELETKK